MERCEWAGVPLKRQTERERQRGRDSKPVDRPKRTYRWIKMDGERVKPESDTQMVSRSQTLTDNKTWIASGETDRYRRRQIERHGLTPEKAGVLRI